MCILFSLLPILRKVYVVKRVFKVFQMSHFNVLHSHFVAEKYHSSSKWVEAYHCMRLLYNCDHARVARPFVSNNCLFILPGYLSNLLVLSTYFVIE